MRREALDSTLFSKTVLVEPPRHESYTPYMGGQGLCTEQAAKRERKMDADAILSRLNLFVLKLTHNPCTDLWNHNKSLFGYTEAT